MPKRTDVSSFLIIGMIAALLTTPLHAELQKREPLVSKSKIEAVAAACDANVTVFGCAGL